jgi:hypothetical protein
MSLALGKRMIMRWGRGAAAAACVASLLSGCGGQDGKAAETTLPKKNTPVASATDSAGAPRVEASSIDATRALKEINPAIPVYADARFRDDLTRRDSVMVRNQYGPKAEVYTLATDDSFPQVWHYYTTYLAQFRANPPLNPYPPENQTWRSMEVHLNEAMQDPFIPGDTMKAGARHITLQLAETEAEPRTVIRYIITPEPVTTPVALQ